MSIIRKIADNTATIDVYERGVGPTQACGSAACASAALSLHNQLANSPLNIKMPGGVCQVSWPDQTQSILLSGPASNVYQGSWNG